MQTTKEQVPCVPAAPEGFTGAQARAVEARGRKLLVSAGPGSGKTRVLVARFLSFLERERLDPERLLAVTFTEKAANEMKSRIVDELRGKNMHDERRALEGAWVSTLHGFCARLLKEHPIEAGVDPGFRVMSEEEADTLRESITDDAIETCAEETPAFLELLMMAGEERLRASLLALFEKCRTLGLSVAQAFESAKPPDLKPLVKSLDRALEEVVAAGRAKGATGAAKRRADLVEESRV